MDFSGPEPADFANVTALNRAFLIRLRSPSVGRKLRDHIPEALQGAVAGLTDRHVERLSAAPFLLMSLQERDDRFWRDAALDDPVADLFDSGSDPHHEVSVAAVSFVWQLAQRNPYAARLVCGAAPAWCDRIAELTLFALLQRVMTCRDFLRPRFAGNDPCWRKLLGPGLSSRRLVRESAYLACLQTLLTDERVSVTHRLRAAACNTPVPVLTVSRRE